MFRVGGRASDVATLRIFPVLQMIHGVFNVWEGLTHFYNENN